MGWLGTRVLSRTAVLSRRRSTATRRRRPGPAVPAFTPRYSQRSCSTTTPERYQDDRGLPDWKGWFTKEEYGNPWDINGSWLAPLSSNTSLDQASRFLLQELQDMYHLSLNNPQETVTTERCNKILYELADDTNFHDAKADVDVSHQRAQRADAILQTMHSLYHPVKEQYQNANKLLPKRFPLPTYESYFLVMKLYASMNVKGMTNTVPRRCEELIEQMKSTGITVKIVQYNQTIAAWANCSDEEKSVHAAQLLLTLLEADFPVDPDASSVSHTVRACSYEQDAGKKHQALSAEVAKKLWKTLTKKVDTDSLKQPPPIDSYLILHFLRAWPNITSTKDRSQMIVETYQTACQMGKVNVYIVEELTRVSPPEVMKTLDLNRKLPARTLLQKLPAEFKDNADGRRGGS